MTDAELELKLARFRSDMMEYRGDLMADSFELLLDTLQRIADGRLLGNNNKARINEAKGLARWAIACYHRRAMVKG